MAVTSVIWLIKACRTHLRIMYRIAQDPDSGILSSDELRCLEHFFEMMEQVRLAAQLLEDEDYALYEEVFRDLVAPPPW